MIRHDVEKELDPNALGKETSLAPCQAFPPEVQRYQLRQGGQLLISILFILSKKRSPSPLLPR